MQDCLEIDQALSLKAEELFELKLVLSLYVIERLIYSAIFVIQAIILLYQVISRVLLTPAQGLGDSRGAAAIHIRIFLFHAILEVLKPLQACFLAKNRARTVLGAI